MKTVNQQTTVKEKLGKTYLRTGVAVGTALALAPAANAADPLAGIYTSVQDAGSGLSSFQLALYGILAVVIAGLIGWKWFNRTAK